MHPIGMCEFLPEKPMQINSHSLRDAKRPYDDREPAPKLPLKLLAGLAVALLLCAVAGIAFGQSTAFDAARAERVAFEQKHGTIVVDRDRYVFDQAVRIASGTTIDGRGATWSNQFHVATNPLNATAFAYPSQLCGWIDPIATNPKSDRSVTLHEPHKAENYNPGTLVYVWAAGQGPQPWHPFGADASKYGLGCRRLAVVARDGATLTLDGPIDYARATDICWLANAQPIPDVKRDSYLMPGVADGVYWLTSGKSVADELVGEWVEVANGELKTRAARDYRQAALAKWSPTENVTIKGVTFGQPAQEWASVLFVKFARNWRFEDCTFEGHVMLAAATDIEFVRCKFRSPPKLNAPLQINTTTRVTLRDCTLTSPARNGNGICFATDEADADTQVIGCTFSDSDNGVRSGIGCERMHVRDCTFRGIRLCSFLLGGPDNSLERIRIVEEKESYLHGPRLTIRDYRTTGRAIVFGGDRQRLDGIWANPLILGHFNGGPSSGTYRDCTPPTFRATAGVWTLIP